MRQQLGVDVQLAHAASDELGVLATEIEDDDGVRSGLDAVRGAIRGSDMERRLEICLDLGVVRGQDPVTGIGRLAMDRAPALLGRRAPTMAVWLLGPLAQSGRRCGVGELSLARRVPILLR